MFRFDEKETTDKWRDAALFPQIDIFNYLLKTFYCFSLQMTVK